MNQEDKLKILKEILLTDERELASSIEEKIKTLENTINEQENLSEIINPIINKKLTEFVNDMPQKMGSTLTETLKEEVKNSQANVIETLYPIMGKLLKRYVKHELQLISEKIRNQIKKYSYFKRLRLKFKSKTSGVSEADLILQDQLNPRVEQLMVIEKGSGLLVSEYSKTNNINQDMIAGLLTAIKSFAEDAITTQNQEIQNIEYESYHIHLQNFSSYYIAVVISGTYNIIFKELLEDKLLDFAQNFITQDDIKNQEIFSKKLMEYFKDKDI